MHLEVVRRLDIVPQAELKNWIPSQVYCRRNLTIYGLNPYIGDVTNGERINAKID